MEPTTNTINAMLPFNLGEMQNKRSEPDLLIAVLKKNHLKKLEKELEAKEDSVSTEKVISSDNQNSPNNISSEPNSSSNPKLRKRVSKFELKLL